MRTTPEAIRNKRQHLPEALLVEPAIQLPADPGAERQSRQRQREQYQPGAVERHGAERGEGRDMNRHDERLIEGARLVLRPAAKLRPDRRQHAGIAAEAAQDAADEADRDIGAAAARRRSGSRGASQRIDAVGGEERAERDLRACRRRCAPAARRRSERRARRPAGTARAAADRASGAAPDRAELHRKPAGDDQKRRVDRREACSQTPEAAMPQRKACRARSEPAEERAAPQHGERRQRQRGDSVRPH